jgi:hypothetical protein
MQIILIILLITTLRKEIINVIIPHPSLPLSPLLPLLLTNQGQKLTKAKVVMIASGKSSINLVGNKKLNFLIWSQIVSLINNKIHLTSLLLFSYF